MTPRALRSRLRVGAVSVTLAVVLLLGPRPALAAFRLEAVGRVVFGTYDYTGIFGEPGVDISGLPVSISLSVFPDHNDPALGSPDPGALFDVQGEDILEGSAEVGGHHVLLSDGLGTAGHLQRLTVSDDPGNRVDYTVFMNSDGNSEFTAIFPKPSPFVVNRFSAVDEGDEHYSGYVAASGIGYVPFWIRQFTVTSVPEPSLWSALVAGFGLAGAAMRRRSRGRTQN